MRTNNKILIYQSLFVLLMLLIALTATFSDKGILQLLIVPSFVFPLTLLYRFIKRVSVTRIYNLTFLISFTPVFFGWMSEGHYLIHLLLFIIGLYVVYRLIKKQRSLLLMVLYPLVCLIFYQFLRIFELGSIYLFPSVMSLLLTSLAILVSPFVYLYSIFGFGDSFILLDKFDFFVELSGRLVNPSIMGFFYCMMVLYPGLSFYLTHKEAVNRGLRIRVLRTEKWLKNIL